MNFKKICILGLGYIGLPTASTFAAHGVKVIGVDVNPHIVETLQRGGIHIHEPGLRDIVKAALASGNFTVSTQPEEADAFIIAVPTPFHHNKFGEFQRTAIQISGYERSAIQPPKPLSRFCEKAISLFSN